MQSGINCEGNQIPIIIFWFKADEWWYASRLRGIQIEKIAFLIFYDVIQHNVDPIHKTAIHRIAINKIKKI